MQPDVEVGDREVRAFVEGIHAQYGYDFRGYEAQSLRRRVGAVLARSGARHLDDLLERLLEDPSLAVRLLDDLTVKTSELFRDPPFYRAFRTRVLPILRTYPELKIWHAGCASGEEVYATAIVLSEAGLYDRARIYATDVSERALDHAREGIYPADAVGALVANFEPAGCRGRLEDYFSYASRGIRVRDELRRNVVFFRHDLVGDDVLGEMQVVFCRNVLIYFGAALRHRVLDLLARSLCRGGFLCLGSSERGPAGTPLAPFAARERIFRHGVPS